MIFRIFFVSLICLNISFSAVIPAKSGEEKEEVFSAAPNNTPVTRVYVFGKPIYIRQPFMIPQRNISNELKEEELDKFLSRPNLFDRRHNRNAYERNSYDRNAYEIVDAYTPPKPKYPLKSCYTEKSGFMCCNRHLEKVMRESVDNLRKDDWKNCNMQTLSNKVQRIAEDQFGTDFETIVGVGDFASKIHFYSDHVCKMEEEGRVILAYATPNRHNYVVPYNTL